MQAAVFRRFGAGNKDFLLRYRAFGNGKLVRLGINRDTDDALRYRKFLGIPVSREHDGLFHELRPDRASRSRAGETELPVVIETHPDRAHQIVVYPTNQPS